MAWRRVRKFFRKWGWLGSVATFGSWTVWLVFVLTGLTGAVVMAALWSQVGSFWQAYGWAGIATIGLATWFVIVMALAVSRIATRMPRNEDLERKSPNALRATSPEKESERHYSTSDKDRISELLHELSGVVANHAAPMESEAQDVTRVWENLRSDSRVDGIQLLIERLTKIGDTADSVQHTLYTELPKKYHRDAELIREIIDPSTPNWVTVFRQETRNFVRGLEHCTRILEGGSPHGGEVVALMNPMIQIFRHATAQVNDWIDQSQKRVKEKERFILGR